MTFKKLDSVDELIKALEELCPGCSFKIATTEIGSLVKIREAGHDFTVDLSEMNQTPEEWFQAEIQHQLSLRPLSLLNDVTLDLTYNVFCPECGKVNLSQRGYSAQLDHPDRPWICPHCGNHAQFDDVTYEEFFEERD